MFKNYHYLSSDLHKGTDIFIGYIWGKPVGFIGTLHQASQIKNMKRVTRLVVLPDYQGIGIGRHLLDYCGEYYKNKGFLYYIRTSHPAVNIMLSRNDKWILKNIARTSKNKGTMVGYNKTLSNKRLGCSWKYVGLK